MGGHIVEDRTVLVELKQADFKEDQFGLDERLPRSSEDIELGALHVDLEDVRRRQTCSLTSMSTGMPRTCRGTPSNAAPSCSSLSDDPTRSSWTCSSMTPGSGVAAASTWMGR